MAREFNGSNQYLSIDVAPVTANTITMACWFNPDSLASYQTIFSLENKNTTKDYRHLAVKGNTNPKELLWENRSTSQESIQALSTTTVSADTWQHACGVNNGDSDHIVYLNGGGKATNSSTSTPSTPNRVSIGRTGDSSPTSYLNGSVAEVGMWDVALTDAEIASLAAGVCPLMVRPASLVFYMPLVRDNDEDVVGGLSLTAFNTPTIDTHPPVIYPSAQMLYSVAAVVTPRKYIVNGRIYEATGERKAIVNGRILEETVAADGWSITNIDLDDDVFDGQTGAIIAISGTVAASGKQVFIEQGGNTVEQTVTAEDASSVTITIGYGGLLTNGAATLLVNNPL